MNRNLGILLSGRGSNFQAIAKAIGEGRLDARLAVVISNKPEAPGLDIARSLGVAAVAIPSKGMDRESHDRLLIAELRSRDVGLVCLAGYMRLLSAGFIRAFPNRVLNIHPSLLPAFPGLDAQHQAWEYGVKLAGCTVHIVDEHLDHGPIVAQAAVDALPGDSSETLAARILAEEHKIYSEAIGLILSGQWRMEGRRVIPTQEGEET
ncbi:MAG: phosphoribosylglycinamide formyltransferase [Bryobacteraceae bacterium]